MNHKAINLVLAIALFLSAYLTFDWNDWTHITVSLVLSLSGVHALLMDSETPGRRRFGRSCLRLAAVLAVFLIVKIILVG